MPAALAGLIATAFGLGATATGILTGIISAAISFGLNLLLGLLNKGPKPEDVKGVYKQSAAARMRHLGRVMTGGYLVFLESQNGNLHQISVFGIGPVEGGYDGWFIDNTPVTLGAGLDIGPSGGDFWAQEEPYSGRAHYIEPRLGAVSQAAFPVLVEYFPEIWTSAHQLNRLACAHIMQAAVDQEDFSKVYKGQVSVIQNIARYGRCYDPRNDTNGFTRNWALITREYLRSPDGARIANSMIDLDLVGIAADISDEELPLKDGGTEPRYAIGVSYSLDAEPKSVIERLMQAGDGRMHLTQEGKIGITAGKWVEPTVHIEDKHIIDIELRDGAGPMSDANEVIVKFTYPEARYSDATCDPWRDEAAISEQGQVRSVTAEAYEIQSHAHARRLAKIIFDKHTPRYQGTVVTTLKGLECYDQRWIYLSCADFGIPFDEPLPFEISEWALNVDNMTVVMTIQSVNPARYDWDAETEEGTAPSIPEEIEQEPIAAPLGVTGEAEYVTIGDVEIEVPDPEDPEATITITAPVKGYVINLAMTVPNRPDLRAEFQIQSSSSSTWQGVPVTEGQFETRSPPVERGGSYAIRGRYKAIGGGGSPWTDGTPVVIP